jgi:hypothetical protein
MKSNFSEVCKQSADWTAPSRRFRLLKERGSGIALGLILMLGTILRFWALGQESLWLDELATAARINLSWADLLNHLVEMKYHPPLHYLLLKAWASAAGHSEYALRSLSAVCGVLSLLVLYRVALLLVSRKAALLTVFFSAISVYRITYAQEARFYSLMALLALLSMYFFIRLWKTPSWKYYLGYVAVSSAGLYNHSYAIFLVVMQNLFILGVFVFSENFNIRRLLHWCTAQVLLAASFLPWIFVFFQAVARIQQSPTAIPRPTLYSIWATFLSYRGDSKLAALIGLTLMLYFLWRLFERTRQPNTEPGRYCWIIACEKEAFWNAALLVCWTAVPILLPYLASKYSSPIYGHRYLQASFYPFILMVSAGILRFRKVVVRILLILLVSGISGRMLNHYYRTDNNEQWREAIRYIDTNAESGDCLFFDAWFLGELAYGYYGQRQDLTLKSVTYTPGMDMTETGVFTDEIVSGILLRLQDCSRLWFVVSHSRDPDGILLERMAPEFATVSCRTFKGIKIYALDRRVRSVEPE